MQVIQHKLTGSGAQLTGFLHSTDPTGTTPKYPSIIIVPGGGYTHIPVAQAEILARTFADHGYQAFYLQYSLLTDVQPLGLTPVLELGRTIQLLHQQAVAWQLDVQQITPVGFSAGGHVVALYNDYWHDWLPNALNTTADQLKPATVVLSYPVINPQYGYPADSATLAKWTANPNELAADQHVKATNRPTFIWVTADDPLVPAINSLAYAQALAQAKVPYELHVFQHGPHGLALANAQTAWRPAANQPHVAHWFNLALEWLTMQSK
ncbi:alpha/beta hydrolase [Lactobacillus sp. CBA3605]|uniref:alpha/beta hydrolase n=1 Tax=Lactobacillus sp. CBA3605 TaxID=2099788 RepID=UPI000CFC70D1|nr:alpha/beta hydrolase [Lactobacillus sp. CBA3605]AVK62117.1 alpha/beta hydrolase [Lactobacillus sp. CBA3605]